MEIPIKNHALYRRLFGESGPGNISDEFMDWVGEFCHGGVEFGRTYIHHTEYDDNWGEWRMKRVKTYMDRNPQLRTNQKLNEGLLPCTTLIFKEEKDALLFKMAWM